jgi:hypothetical protein
MMNKKYKKDKFSGIANNAKNAKGNQGKAKEFRGKKMNKYE